MPLYRFLLSSLACLCLGNTPLVAESPESSLPKASLSDLWALSLGADLGQMSSRDLTPVYGQTLGLPENQVYPGFSISARRHMSQYWFVGLGASSLPKGYSIQIDAATRDEYSLDSLYLRAELGLLLYRAARSFVYVQAEGGPAFLVQAAYAHSGTQTAKGEIHAYGVASGLSLGALWLLMPSVGLDLQFGYRRARLPDSRYTGDNAPPALTAWAVDNSGLFARAGLCFFWGVPDPWGDAQEAPKPAIEPPETSQP